MPAGRASENACEVGVRTDSALPLRPCGRAPLPPQRGALARRESGRCSLAEVPPEKEQDQRADH